VSGVTPMGVDVDVDVNGRHLLLLPHVDGAARLSMSYASLPM